MSRRRRPHYRSDLGWILGVAFGGTLTRSARPVQGFTCVRCCGSPRASSPHGLTAPGLASHDGTLCVQLPPARGCYQLAPRRTFTSNPVPMPGTPPVTATRLTALTGIRHPASSANIRLMICVRAYRRSWGNDGRETGGAYQPTTHPMLSTAGGTVTAGEPSWVLSAEHRFDAGN
jgi:hypothetical protein